MAPKDSNKGTDVNDLKRQRAQAEQQGNPERVRELDEQIATAEQGNAQSGSQGGSQSGSQSDSGR